MLLADRNGDIAYILATNYAIRKENKPYIGCKVLDGTTTDNDWIGFVKPADLPRIINPKKGFIVSANNRAMGDHAINDIGGPVTSTLRTRRYSDLIQESIN